MKEDTIERENPMSMHTDIKNDSINIVIDAIETKEFVEKEVQNKPIEQIIEGINFNSKNFRRFITSKNSKSKKNRHP